MFCVARTLSGTTVVLDEVLASLPTDAPATLIVDCPILVKGTKKDNGEVSCEVPACVDLWFLGKGCLYQDASNPVKLELHGTPKTCLMQIFGKPHDFATIPEVVFQVRPDRVYPDWWGGCAYNMTTWDNVFKPGGLDDRETAEGFQQALDSLSLVGGEVHVAPGTYTLTRTLRVHSRTRLVGDDVNLARLRWMGCDGIAVDPGATNVELRGLRMAWAPLLKRSASQSGNTAITLTSCRDVRIDEVSLIGDSGGTWFDEGIRQSCREADGSASRATRLRLRNMRFIAARILVAIEAADDVLMERVFCTRNIDDDRPSSIGFSIGRAGVPACTDIRLLDCMAERQSIDVLVINVDGLRIEGCYFECRYRQNGHNFSPSERRYIVVQAGQDRTVRALSGEGMDVGFNYFYRTFGSKNQPVVPSPPIEWANEFDRRMTKVFDLGGRFMPSEGNSTPPPHTGIRGVFLNAGDLVYSTNPGEDPVGWVCTTCEQAEIGNVPMPSFRWSPFGPSSSEGATSWRRYGWMGKLDTGKAP